MKPVVGAAALSAFAAACTGGPVPMAEPAAGPTPVLTIVSWNMEHLAEANGSGCRARTDADYAAMGRYAAELNADVIAFQEVESKAAAERVFDPAIYTVIIEERIGTDRQGACRGVDGPTINAQRTGFAVRKGLAFERRPDFTDLQVGSPDLRSGVDLVVRPDRGRPVRLLSVHLKSGCSSGERNEACTVLFQQVPALENWIDRRAQEGVRFAVLGDFNRRLATPDDAVWRDWDDASPPNADLTLASGAEAARCNPRYREFIDFIVLDRRAAADQRGFEEHTYAGEPLSDHCAISVRLTND